MNSLAPVRFPIPKIKPARKCAFNIRDVDPNLHSLFKSVCARRGRTIRGVILAMVHEACKDDKPDNSKELPGVNLKKTLHRHRSIR